MKTLIIICTILISARGGCRMLYNLEHGNYGKGMADAGELIALALILRLVSF